MKLMSLDFLSIGNNVAHDEVGLRGSYGSHFAFFCSRCSWPLSCTRNLMSCNN